MVLRLEVNSTVCLVELEHRIWYGSSFHFPQLSSVRQDVEPSIVLLTFWKYDIYLKQNLKHFKSFLCRINLCPGHLMPFSFRGEKCDVIFLKSHFLNKFFTSSANEIAEVLFIIAKGSKSSNSMSLNVMFCSNEIYLQNISSRIWITLSLRLGGWLQFFWTSETTFTSSRLFVDFF